MDSDGVVRLGWMTVTINTFWTNIRLFAKDVTLSMDMNEAQFQLNWTESAISTLTFHIEDNYPHFLGRFQWEPAQHKFSCLVKIHYIDYSLER